MKKPGWNPIKRNKNIGTVSQGLSKNNKLVIPQKWSDLTVYWERLDCPIANTLSIDNHSVTILVEPTRKGYLHSCTVEDIAKIIQYIPKWDLHQISLIVLRQPKRKEEIISPAWGRYVYYADIGKYSGPGIYLEAQKINRVIKWPLSSTPDQQKELHRLELDGHKIRKDKRNIYIHTTPESVRNTQLYRTLPHEIGHAVDYYLNCIEPSSSARLDSEADYIASIFESKSGIDKEAFAHRYADNFKKQLMREEVIPFDRVLKTDSIAQMALDINWFKY